MTESKYLKALRNRPEMQLKTLSVAPDLDGPHLTGSATMQLWCESLQGGAQALSIPDVESARIRAGSDSTASVRSDRRVSLPG